MGGLLSGTCGFALRRNARSGARELPGSPGVHPPDLCRERGRQVPRRPDDDVRHPEPGRHEAELGRESRRGVGVGVLLTVRRQHAEQPGATVRLEVDLRGDAVALEERQHREEHAGAVPASALAAELRLMATWLGMADVVVGPSGDLAPALAAEVGRVDAGAAG